MIYILAGGRIESKEKKGTVTENFDYATFLTKSNIKHAKHDLFLKNRELLKEKKEYNGRPWSVEYAELGECPECGYPVKAVDHWRGETVCKGCGFVLTDSAPAIPDQEVLNHSSTDKFETGTKTTKDEKKALKRAGRRVLNHTDKSEWRKDQQLLTVDAVSSHFMMNRNQRAIVREVLRNHHPREFHSRLNNKAVITAICMYVMRRDGRLIQYQDKFVRTTGLNEIGYRVVKRNLRKLDFFK